MKIIKNYLTQNRCYQQNAKRVPIGIQLHTIGCSQGTAKSLADYWNQRSVSVCVTYIVDCDTPGKVLQCLPEDTRTWADAGYGNSHLITFEICESDHMKYTGGASYKVLDENKFKADILRGYNTAVELCADICKRYGWNPTDKLPSGLYLISSHDEGRRAGLSSAHVDPTHVWNRLGLTMDGFRKDVQKMMGIDSDIKDAKIENRKIGDSSVDEISKVVYGEAGVIQSYNALLAVAQCIHDMHESGSYGKTITEVMKNNFSAYGGKDTSEESRRAVYDVFFNKKRRYENAKILQFRSFSKYSDGNGNMDKEKCSSLLKKYEYLGKDSRNNQWGSLYFGKKMATSNSSAEDESVKYIVQAGAFSKKENADSIVKKLNNVGISAFVKTKENSYVVQAGVFEQKKYAANLVEKLKEIGVDAIIK